MNINKAKLERWTLWVLAFGLFAAVSLTVAKGIVIGYKDLRKEISRPIATQTENARSIE